MSLSRRLDRLATPGAYPGAARPAVRWGQMIRESASLQRARMELDTGGALVPLSKVGIVRSGVVTRANAYFLVNELPFDKIPQRLNVTRHDLKRVAAVTDGLNYTLKIEREFLKPVIKGPDNLVSAFSVKRTSVRLFDVTDDREQLKKRHANGALAYLRRGETMNYKTSDDDLKGGIPAQRSQVKNRKPFWYSLNVNQRFVDRIVLPEHIDKRYVSTLIEKDDASVVIDTLYVFEPEVEADARVVHAGLNTLFTWYQTELRGRSQHGEGVLKVKIPDYGGIVLANPEKLGDAQRQRLLKAFTSVPDPGSGPSLDELGAPKRLRFCRSRDHPRVARAGASSACRRAHRA